MCVCVTSHPAHFLGYKLLNITKDNDNDNKYNTIERIGLDVRPYSTRVYGVLVSSICAVTEWGILPDSICLTSGFEKVHAIANGLIDSKWDDSQVHRQQYSYCY